MIHNKVTIEGKVISIGYWHETKRGGKIRDMFIEAQSNRTQYFCLTEIVEPKGEEKDIRVGEEYRFEGYVNGLKILGESNGSVHVNKICISKLWKPA